MFRNIHYREIIGFVDEIEGPKLVGKAQGHKLLKFMLNNNSQHRVQVVAWNKEIERIAFHLKPNRVINKSIIYYLSNNSRFNFYSFRYIILFYFYSH